MSIDKAKPKSSLTTVGPERAPNRAMLRAVGFLDSDFESPMIGIASLFSDITPCNSHLDRLARKGVEALGREEAFPKFLAHLQRPTES